MPVDTSACAAPLPPAASAANRAAHAPARPPPVPGRAGVLVFSRQKDPADHKGMRSDVWAACGDPAAGGPGEHWPEAHHNLGHDDIAWLLAHAGLPPAACECASAPGTILQ